MTVEATLRSQYDALLLDLDGTVYQGKDPIAGAVDALKMGTEKQYFVTNNASRSAASVAEHLRDLGFDTSEEFVVTSAQAAARMLTDLIPEGSPVVVIGTEALCGEIAHVGFEPVRTAEGSPKAVVQGHSIDTDWGILAEATFAIRAGAVFVATNTDATLPTERGFAPGNGSMVAAVRTATGVDPLMAGKPAAPIMHDAIRRSGAEHPLVVGDRLDTDIAGANATGIPSLLVLTGVSSALDAVCAIETERPTHIWFDLTALNLPAMASEVGPKTGWTAKVARGVLTVEHVDSSACSTIDGVLTAAAAGWTETGWDEIRVVGDGTEELRQLLGA